MKRTIQLLSCVLLTALMACGGEDPVPEEIAQVSASVSSNQISEGTTATITFRLSQTVDEAVTVNFEVGGTATAQSDYRGINSPVIIPANQSTVTLSLEVLEDDEEEPTEELVISISDPESPLVGLSNLTLTLFLVDVPPSFTLSPGQARSYMVNPNATEETVALFYNLKRSAESNFIVGQQDAFNLFYQDNRGDADMKKTTGRNPGLLGSDFMFITSDRNTGAANNWWYQQEQLIMDQAEQAYNMGLINTFSWHFNEPYDGNDFYTANMTNFQKENAFRSILPGGSNHEYFKTKLDKVAEVVQSMRGSDGKLVPVIFRPFHEFDGHWFWWGQDYCTAQEFIEGWQFMVEYLRDTKQVNNMLFAFSPDNSYTTRAGYLSRYPGDDYVDVLGMDNYSDLNNQGAAGVARANEKLQMVSDLAIERVKISAFTETGYFVEPGRNSPISNFYTEHLYQTLTNNDIQISYMMFWSNYSDTYTVPPPGQSDTQDFIDFANMPKSLLADGLPDLYFLPSD